MKKPLRIIGFFLILCLFIPSRAQETEMVNHNKPEREEWLKDAGFGMFIHWNIDVQLGTVISHSLVGSSAAYADKYIKELPATFNPTDWDPDRVATLARNAGMKYLVFTTKHHNGFCFWDTKSTSFNIMNTPYGKDILSGLVAACRKHGLAVGFYFSTEDFVFSYQQGIKDIKRTDHWEHTAAIRGQYEEYLDLQINELMTQFGKVDMFFIDSEAYREEVKKMVWNMQPNCIITRGAILTPEQFVPGETIDAAWESNMTMGTQWNYKPTNEHYKSGTYLINALIRARSRGGSYLLNIGPDQWGNINEAQQGRLQELAAWNFVNGEAIQNVRPWIVSNEGDIWLTRKKNENTIFAYLTEQGEWPRGERREFRLRSVHATGNTKISVLGQTGNVVEYKPDVDGQAYVEQKEDQLIFSVVRAQRIYNNHKWPNPIVVKIEGIESALEPLKFSTRKAEVLGNQTIQFMAHIKTMGSSTRCVAYIEYRPRVSSLDKGGEYPWKRSGSISFSAVGEYPIQHKDPLFDAFLEEPVEESGIVNASAIQSGIEYRVVVDQDGLVIQGNLMNLN